MPTRLANDSPILANIMAFYGLDAATENNVVNIILAGKPDAITYYRAEISFHREINDIADDVDFALINSMASVAAPLKYSPFLYATHYASITVADDADEPPYDKLPNLRRLKCKRIVENMPASVRHLIIEADFYFRSRKQLLKNITHLHCNSKQVVTFLKLYGGESYLTRNIREAPAAKSLWPALRYLTIERSDEYSIAWGEVEHVTNTIAGPITPSTVIYYVNSLKFSEVINLLFTKVIVSDSLRYSIGVLNLWLEFLPSFSGINNFKFLEHGLLTLSARFTDGSKLHIERAKKDGTFIPLIYERAPHWMAFDFGIIKSNSLININIDGLPKHDIMIKMPRDSTGLRSVVAPGATFIHHYDPVKHENKRYPLLTLAGVI